MSIGSVAGYVSTCCHSLAQIYPDQVISPNASVFDAWNERWADNAQLIPACIFRPLSATEVSTALRIISTAASSNQGHCRFAIKSGGHTPWAGANNVDDGVTIDLTDMSEAILSSDRSYISLGGGGLWRDAYTKSNGSGVAYPGGRCPGTGVGGVTLGGGYSWFTGETGFVADNIINYEIVLASGEIVNANSTSNSDLFKALKGGNNNFGIVTRFDLAVFEHDQMVFGGLVIVPANASDAVLEGLQTFTDDSNGIHASAGLTIEYYFDSTTGDGQILLWLIDTNATGEHAALQPFFEMEPKLLNQVQITAIAEYPSNIPAVARVLMADATFVNDLDVLKGVQNITMGIFQKYSYIPGLTWDFQYEPLSRHVIAASNANGGNIMGLKDAEDDLLIVFIMPLWSDAQYDSDVYLAAEEWYNSIKSYTDKHGKAHPFEFANYAAPFQNVMASYGAENLQFLKDMSLKYDPQQLFQNVVSGGYKL